MKKDYNGWSTRETWLINIHFNPVSKEDLEGIRQHVEEMFESLIDKNMFLFDYVDPSLINWRELRETLP